MNPEISAPDTVPKATPLQRGSQLGGAHASLAAIVFWGLFVRIAYIVLAHSYRFRIREENFAFGWETGRIARALASGQGFSNPFHGVTGPTAWIAPVYPFLAAGVFKLTGIYTNASSFILLTINSVFAAFTAVPIYFVAKRCFGARVAKWSAWTWALLPYVIYWSVRFVWETSISAFLLMTLLWLTLELEERATAGQWAWWGGLWGFLALTNPSCVSVLPMFAGWLAWRKMRNSQAWVGGALLAAVMFVAVLTPWTVRNYGVFHKLIFVRGNAGAELRMGNGPYARGIWQFWLHPTQNKLELERYRELGEAKYVEAKKHEALDWMRQRPGRAAWLMVKKAVYFWAGLPRSFEVAGLLELKNSLFLASSLLAFFGLGLAIVRRKPGLFLFGSLLLIYPITYYIVFPHPRYRHPIEPAMVILGAYLISETREAQRKAWETATLERMALNSGGATTTLSVIIPCYNERNTIRHVVDTVRRSRLTHDGRDDVARLQKEIVIVDDYSTDGTREVLAELEEEARFAMDGTPLRILYHEQNQGKGAAVRTGIKHAGGDLVIIQDADMEYDPADFPTLLAPILAGRADAVFGNRFHGGAHRVLYFWHMVANRTLTLICNMLSDLNLADMEVGYKVFKREIFEHITLKSNRFGFEPEVTIKTAKLGCRIYEVPVSYHGRTYAEGKKIGWKDGVAAIWHMVKYRFFD